MSSLLFRLFLHLYPAHFREEYGGEMARLFRDRCQREGVLRVVLEALPDLAVTAWRQHMDTLRQDLLFTFRTWAKKPGFTVVVFLTLALGIGATTAIFSLVNGVLIEPLPYREPGRIAQLYEKRMREGRLRNPVSMPDFEDWRRQNTVFEGMAAMETNTFTLAGDLGPELVRAGAVTPDFFQVLGIDPQFGRTFLPEEAPPGKDRVVVLNYGLWQRRFGGDPKIVGRTILLTGEPYTVVGILPDIPHAIHSDAQLWKPLGATREMVRGIHFLTVLARLRPGVTLAQARAHMDIIAGRLEQHHADENTGHGVNVFPLAEEVTGNVKPALLMLMGAVVLVLLIACTNVANLTLVRTWQRRREISIRTALGAGSGRVVRQLLTETLVLSLLSGVAGLLLAYWGVHALTAAKPGNLPRLGEVEINQRVLLFTLVVSLATGAAFGLAPAFYAARGRLGEALKAGSRGVLDPFSRNRGRSVLVAAEVALALLLAIGAGLMMQSFLRLAGVDPGFDADNVLAIHISLLDKRYGETQARLNFFRDLLSRLRAAPGVLQVGATTALPLGGRDAGSNFLMEGKPALPYSQQPNARYRTVTPGYFETMRIALRAGRLFSDQDAEKAPRVVVINETMARRYWPEGHAAGKRITLSRQNVWREIVGVVADVKHYALDGETRPEMYLPYAQQAQFTMTVVARASSAPERLADAARRELAQIDKTQPITRIQTLQEVLSLSVAQPRLYSGVLAAFSVVAFGLAALGIYGVMSFAVGQRSHEIGVRMALGAPAASVAGMVLRQGLTMCAIGVVCGIAGALALTRMLGKLLYGISPSDPATFAGVSLLLIAVAAAACYLPARRATRVDPLVVLRSD